MAARRIGAEQSATRALILDAAQALMVDEGYAAVTTRGIALRAGVKPALVQYYFPRMEDLLLAVYRRAAGDSLRRQAAALASRRPLHALWALMSDPAFSALAIEFMALANHRPTIRAEIARVSAEARDLQTDALAALARSGAIPNDAPVDGLLRLLIGAARGLVMEEGLGITGGHGPARAIVDRLLDTLEPGTAG